MENKLLFKAWTCCRQSLLLQLLLLFWVATGSAQSVAVHGTVTDAQGVLPGVNVQLKNKTVSTLTDGEGKFTIPAEVGDVLVFTYLGYKEVAVAVDSRTNYTVTLEEDATALKEVTVNAGYYTVKDKERTGSIAKLTAAAIEHQPVTNVLAAMQGRMAGVNIVQTTGTPGGGFEIQIRGQNSIRANGNSPLYIIDGVPYASDPIGSGLASAIIPTQPSPLNSINPDQIESIEVLKDADATAIYGSRGANGVVLITTKKGTAGKTRFTGRLSQGVGSVTRFMDLLTTPQYIAMREEAFANDGISPLPDYAYDVNGTWDRNRYTDWQKVLFGGSAEMTNVQGSMSGGTGQTHYLLGGTYSKQTTVFPGSFDYKKGNVHLNVKHQSEDKKFESTVSVGYTLQDNTQPRINFIREAVNMAPNAPALYTDDGSINWENNTFNNPLSNLEGDYIALTDDLLANALLSYQITPSLQVKSSFGLTSLNSTETTTLPSSMFNPAYGLGSEYSAVIAGNVTRKSWIAEPQLDWHTAVGKGSLSLLVGSTFQSQKSTSLVQYAEGFSSNSLIHNLASANHVFTIGSDATTYKYQAFFGRINYTLLDRYILNLTGRRDGSSRFGPGKQFATFGAVGAAWLFSKEAFLRDQTVLSFGKLRASYGTTGNDQIGDYQFLNTYSSSGVSYGGQVGLEPTRLFNPEFGWETSTKFEVALEAGIFKDRIFLTAGFYDNRSSNQLTGIPLPGTTGFTSLLANLDATVQNTGLEFTLQTRNVTTQDFSWTTSFNFTQAKNKLLAFPDLAGSTYANQLVIGQALNIQKVYHFTGVDPQTGVYTFDDVNGDGMLTSVEDKQTLKDFNPKYFGGLQNTFKYQRWQLDFLFQFVKQENYNSSVLFGLPGMENNQPTTVLNHWQQPGDVTSNQLYTTGSNGTVVDGYFKFFDSDGAISDASYVRLKNISLSYDIPLKDLSCKVFFEGQNLLTFTKYQGADPEFISPGYLAPLRVFSAGVQFSF
ncbi:SusC/RagA family TonB-linked outer membrane protein [Flavobacterium sp.]